MGDVDTINHQIEFQSLQSQINPHFLYNTLESIRGQALIDGVPEIAEMTETLSSYFRYCVSSSDSLVHLEDELQNIRNYYSIQQYRFGNRLTMDICLDEPETLCLNTLIPKLTLQPILENAIFHGIEPSVRPGHIRIRVTMTPTRMLILVSDNGIGIEQDGLDALNRKLDSGRIETDARSTKHTGIALINVNKRIQLCFGPAYGLRVRSVPKIGTDVEVVLPMTRHPDDAGGQWPSSQM